MVGAIAKGPASANHLVSTRAPRTREPERPFGDGVRVCSAPVHSAPQPAFGPGLAALERAALEVRDRKYARALAEVCEAWRTLPATERGRELATLADALDGHLRERALAPHASPLDALDRSPRLQEATTSTTVRAACSAVWDAYAEQQDRLHALLAAVYADPADDAARRAVAAFLTEDGDPWGELIELQVRRGHDARLSFDPRENQLCRSVEQRLARWFGSRPNLSRGFPINLIVGRVPESLGRPEWSTIESLVLTCDDPALAQLVTHPCMRSLRFVSGVGDGVLAALVDAVAAGGRPIERVAGRGLAGLPDRPLPGLRLLSLPWPLWRRRRLPELWAGPFCAGITQLWLDDASEDRARDVAAALGHLVEHPRDLREVRAGLWISLAWRGSGLTALRFDGRAASSIAAVLRALPPRLTSLTGTELSALDAEKVRAAAERHPLEELRIDAGPS